MASIRIGVCALLLFGCDSGQPSSVGIGSAAVEKLTEALVLDGAIAGTRAPVAIDAPTQDAGSSCMATSHLFRFGTMAVPVGWCWRRTGEGDDESGVIVDPAGRVRFTYRELAFANSSDVCAGKQSIADREVHGVALRTCRLPNGHQCASFHGAANLCTADARDVRDADVTLDSLLQTIAPRR